MFCRALAEKNEQRYCLSVWLLKRLTPAKKYCFHIEVNIICKPVCADDHILTHGIYLTYCIRQNLLYNLCLVYHVSQRDTFSHRIGNRKWLFIYAFQCHWLLSYQLFHQRWGFLKRIYRFVSQWMLVQRYVLNTLSFYQSIFLSINLSIYLSMWCDDFLFNRNFTWQMNIVITYFIP